MWDRTDNQIEVVFIRHGKTPLNEKKAYIGKTDEHLSKAGIEEIQKKIGENKYPSAAGTIYTSPMRRCLETADIIYKAQKKIEIKEWVEMDFGVFEGKNYQELKNQKDYQDWLAHNGESAIPHGEKKEEFIKRCREGFQKAYQEMEMTVGHQPMTCVVHGGTMMAILSSFGQGDYYDYQCENGEGYVALARRDENKDVVFTNIHKL